MLILYMKFANIPDGPFI